MVSDNYFTVNQAAKYLGVSRQTVSRWLKLGLPHDKVGKMKLIPRAVLSTGKVTCPVCGSPVYKWCLKDTGSFND